MLSQLTSVSAPIRLQFLLSLVSIFCIGFQYVQADDSAVPDSLGFESLFDGQSLRGWKGDERYWRVQDGAIIGEIPPGQTLRKNTWLVWEAGQLEDFDLRLQFRLNGLPAANSGIQIRCQVDTIDHVSGYQADLDMGTTWLGRIYDEHGRALLVERGSRVQIGDDGVRQIETFAPADQYTVLFRENAWNDYRIVAVGSYISVYVNGTLFSELRDEQSNARDLQGKLAFQLHSGPETKIEFRNIHLKQLPANSDAIKPFEIQPKPSLNSEDTGLLPRGNDGETINLDFESGTLKHWTATGDAFRKQPVSQDGISGRWPGQVSNKQGDYFIGGYELAGDGAVGTLTSDYFKLTKPHVSFLLSGGNSEATRVEILLDAGSPRIIYSASGQNREQMRRVAVNLKEYVGQLIAVRLVDESRGGWGHLNFDDFRLHDVAPVAAESIGQWRSTANPLLQHLRVNPNSDESDSEENPHSAHATVAKMHVPDGFSVDLIASEPQLHQPMAFAFDAGGRLWVVEGHCYPQKRPDGQGLDRILIFSDQDNDGQFETSKLFYEGLNLVSGLEVGHGGVWVGAAPELLFIPNRDGDDKPDGPPQVLLDGFGFGDTHETINSFMWGPDGWLYGNQGVFNVSRVGKPGAADHERTELQAGVWRYHPIKHRFEVFAHGGSNQWGLDYDQHGQIFMTHCRSFWGRGSTTHVMQGGHYWNQVNSGYAPFICATELPGKPWMKNYLLASARYGHGEGGAGKPGSRLVYGGHSHVGTMIYLGGNWPKEYHNHLFTHNLHGHQMNHQVNLREAGGYNTIHAGHDVLFCSDPQYIGVDLQYGPDGAVYISDWYDPRHCHSPNVEQWDRGNGRIYRMKYDANWKPTAVNYAEADALQLISALKHANHWHRRTARLSLAERANNEGLSRASQTALRELLEHRDVDQRLEALWTLHCTGTLTRESLILALQDESEYVRGWAVQLATETIAANDLQNLGMTEEEVCELLVSFAAKESSLFVKRYLASAIQRLPSECGWTIAEGLASEGAVASDRDLPMVLWYGIAQLITRDVARSIRLAESSRVPSISDYIYWYSARQSDIGRKLLLSKIFEEQAEDTKWELLSLLHLAVSDLRKLELPSSWNELGEQLYQHSDAAKASQAIAIGIAFSDPRAVARVRDQIAAATGDYKRISTLLPLLAGEQSEANLAVYLKHLSVPELTESVISQLGAYDDLQIADKLLAIYPAANDNAKESVMEVLSSRVSWANRVLDAVDSGAMPRDAVTAFHARQIASLGDDTLSQRLEREWGKAGQTTDELRKRIAQVVDNYKKAPLWAYSQASGGAHFNRLCAQCHVTNSTSQAVAPSLAGSGAKGIEYLVENVVDPNAVIGRDYQARVLLTVEGRVITGLVENETESSITIRTLSDRVTIAKDDIDRFEVSSNSFMPQGLLDSLNDREQIELFLFLMRQ